MDEKGYISGNGSFCTLQRQMDKSILNESEASGDLASGDRRYAGFENAAQLLV